jgi:hypothetical protein
MTYRAPLRDLSFALTEVVNIGQVNQGGAFPDFDADLMTAVLEAAGDLATGVLAPLNRIGDKHGAVYANGKVTAAPGFADAYKAFAEGGWNSLAADPAYGGQGLPKALELAVFETIHAANMAFGLCPMLTQGAIEALHAHGSDRQKTLYLPRMISGEWTGTMNLTEPQSGSDLGTLTTRAEPDGEGQYRLYGQKIYITWGDHDVADNIVHLVLARLPDAPEGVKGISLFLAPKFLTAEDGSLGAANDVRPGGIEHKLGIHASPTCIMLFEGARAELVGQEGQGLAHMFTMMNAARLNVGMQGVGIAERAYQGALAYAVERKQGRSAWTGEHPARIFDHPDVRRMLMLMKARIEAARAICLATGIAADVAQLDIDPALREAARLREELFVPVAKAWSTDVGVEVASMGVQIHGGMGFVEETGAAQHYRDARIAPIYEGTNGIQAIDLMGRKLAMGNGEAVRQLINDIWPTASALKSHDNAWLHTVGTRLENGIAAVQAATGWLIERRGHAQPDALAGAAAYLKLLGDVMGGWMLGKGALAAARHLAAGEGDAAYWRTKIGLARIYSEHILAQAPGLTAAVTQGSADLFNITAESMGA